MTRLLIIASCIRQIGEHKQTANDNYSPITPTKLKYIFEMDDHTRNFEWNRDTRS